MATPQPPSFPNFPARSRVRIPADNKELKTFRRCVSRMLRIAGDVDADGAWAQENFRKAVDAARRAANRCDIGETYTALMREYDLAFDRANMNREFVDMRNCAELVRPWRQGSFVDTRDPEIARWARWMEQHGREMRRYERQVWELLRVIAKFRARERRAN